MYSGRTAAEGFRALGRRTFDVVVVVSPSHREYFDGITVYPGAAYATPVGELRVDAVLREALTSGDPSIVVHEAGHRGEHAVEVQVPFIIAALGDKVPFLPVVMGDQRSELCRHLGARLAEALAGRSCLIVASSDLSHYHAYDSAVAIDGGFIALLGKMDAEGILRGLDEGSIEACGGGPVARGSHRSPVARGGRRPHSPPVQLGRHGGRAVVGRRVRLRAGDRLMKRRPKGKPAATGKPSLSIVGAGAVGSALALSLAKSGWRLRSVISRTGRDAVALARAAGAPRASTELADLDLSAETIIIAVRDGELPGVAKSLAGSAGRGLRGKVVLHTSGVHSASVLSPLAKSGASVGTFHPLYTFPRGAAPARIRSGMNGIVFTVDGDGPAVKAAERLAAGLGGTALPVPPEMRPLYHAACVFASGYLAVMMHAVSTLAERSRIARPWTSVFGPILTATMENTVRRSPADALTGPVLRGDLETIGLHLDALGKFAPEFIPLYTVAALEMARVAVERGRLKREEYDRLLSEFRRSIRTGTTTRKRR
jgi:AmmeMemoRadiSam system protein B